MFFTVIIYNIFLRLDWSNKFWWGGEEQKDHRIKHYFHHFLSRGHTINMILLLLMLTLICLIIPQSMFYFGLVSMLTLTLQTRFFLAF